MIIESYPVEMIVLIILVCLIIGAISVYRVRLAVKNAPPDPDDEWDDVENAEFERKVQRALRPTKQSHRWDARFDGMEE